MQGYTFDEFEKQRMRRWCSEQQSILAVPPTDRVELEQRARVAGEEAQRLKAKELGVPNWGEDRYREREWTCPECGTHMVRGEGGIGWYEAFPPCPCQQKAYAEAYALYKETFWRDAAEGQWRKSGVPKRFASMSLANFMKRPGTETAIKKATAYAETFELGKTTRGLWLVGGFGCGKTALALAVGRAIVEKTLAHAAFWPVDKLLSAEKATYGREPSDILKTLGYWPGETGATTPVEHAMRAEVLILDDLAQVEPSSHEVKLLSELIDERYRRELPVIVTTNLKAQELAERIGGRSVSRLYEMCEAVPISASDYRRELGKQSIGAN